jgi:hypothetical protein
MIWQAVWAGFGYFQREAGYTRTGSHNSRVHGRETGQWREADLAVAHWLQHTSRDGDMQLHVHSQIVHTARTATTSMSARWPRSCPSIWKRRSPAASAWNGPRAMTATASRSKGISGQMMRLFSSRRESITADVRARATRFEQQYGRKPSQREAVFAATMDDRADWDKAAVQQRHLAVAADAELRRRHPHHRFASLRSVEPEHAIDAQGGELIMAAGSRPRRWAGGSRTWPPRTARSPTGSRTGRA